ncbi:MAG: hypothetical protein IKE58_12880 [Blautia sp.]|nr:hypothetical protein [Blautia sp.]
MGKKSADWAAFRRHWLMQAAEWLHVTLILAMLPVLGYSFVPERQGRQLFELYLAGWLIFPFICAVRVSVMYLRYYSQYLAACLCLLLLAFWFSGQAGKEIADPLLRQVYRGIMIAELVVLMFDADEIRRNEIGRRKALRENDIGWVPRYSFLERPGRAGIVCLALCYTVGLLLPEPVLCDLAFGTSFAYLLLWLPYHGINKKEAYLASTDYIRHVPQRRIRTISLAFILVTMTALAAAGCLGILALPYRHYITFRLPVRLAYETEPEELYRPMMPEMAELPDWMGEGQEPHQTAAWALVLQAAATVLSFLILGLILTRLLKMRFLSFRDSYEDGDLSVSLKKDEEETRRPIQRRRHHPSSGDGEEIRRKYRRTIRRHRRDIPAPWETPADIEEKANLANTPEGDILHTMYEKARYGRPQA